MLLPTAHGTNPTLLILECGMTAMAVALSFALPRLGGKWFARIERRFASFTRSFTLPQTVDTESVTATNDAGVLTINLLKKAEAQPKQVKIAVAGSQPAKTVEASAV